MVPGMILASRIQMDVMWFAVVRTERQIHELRRDLFEGKDNRAIENPKHHVNQRGRVTGGRARVCRAAVKT